MTEMELLARLRDEIPANMIPARAEAALLAEAKTEQGLAGHGPAARSTGGLRQRPGHTWPHARRLALVGGTGFALAVGVFVAQAVLPGSARPAGTMTVRELAYRTSAAAAAQPDVRPGQWVYWQEMTSGGVFEVWTTADSTRAAYVYHGRVRFLKFTAPLMRNGRVVLRHGRPVMRPGGQSVGQPQVFPAPQPYGGITVSWLSGRIPISYADLGSLPSDPTALIRYVSGLHLPGWGPAPVREFEIIKDLLITYIMPPSLTAELYRALGDIPGVTVDQHAVDVAGRRGVGFRVSLPQSAGGGFDEIVINPSTYLLMGQQLIGRGLHGNGTAILKRALVSGPGVMP